MMNNYLLSIDPSIKNTGFTLWEKENISNNFIIIWKPIFVKSYSFKNYKGKRSFYWAINANNDELDLIIESGFPNMKGSETQDHLRGFIAGQFNKLLTKDMLISPKEWQNWYLKELRYEEDDLFKDKKWNKEKSLYIVGGLIRQQNWNIKISNHDEADSLLIGWYYLNKENK
ncbi:hypothetical protein [Spiroplasma endosymbiont of Dasysyrphus albostriatus]|uniref:hypothetical protein n=1 Tax=Spiroplasma endosymbiont of Dasysyrphus albostriatus TaxID=3066299 RepID=UPI0030D625E6